jgi:hypothetical protein
MGLVQASRGRRQHHRRDYRQDLKTANGAAGRGDAKTVHRRLPCIATILEDQEARQCERAAKQAGISLSPVMLTSTRQSTSVFRSMEQDRADAFMVSDEPENSINRETIVELAAKADQAIYPTAIMSKLAVDGLSATWWTFSPPHQPHR